MTGSKVDMVSIPGVVLEVSVEVLSCVANIDVNYRAARLGSCVSPDAALAPSLQITFSNDHHQNAVDAQLQQSGPCPLIA